MSKATSMMAVAWTCRAVDGSLRRETRMSGGKGLCEPPSCPWPAKCHGSFLRDRQRLSGGEPRKTIVGGKFCVALVRSLSPSPNPSGKGGLDPILSKGASMMLAPGRRAAPGVSSGRRMARWQRGRLCRLPSWLGFLGVKGDQDAEHTDGAGDHRTKPHRHGMDGLADIALGRDVGHCDVSNSMGGLSDAIPPIVVLHTPAQKRSLGINVSACSRLRRTAREVPPGRRQGCRSR